MRQHVIACPTTTIGLATPDRSPPKQYTDTKAGLYYPSGFESQSSSARFCTYNSVTLQNGDVCSVGDWVLVKSDATDPAVCRIEEILSPLSPDGKNPQCASAALLQRAVLTEIADVYRMPRVRLDPNGYFLQPFAVSIGTTSNRNAILILTRKYSALQTSNTTVPHTNAGLQHKVSFVRSIKSLLLKHRGSTMSTHLISC